MSRKSRNWRGGPQIDLNRGKAPKQLGMEGPDRYQDEVTLGMEAIIDRAFHAEVIFQRVGDWEGVDMVKTLVEPMTDKLFLYRRARVRDWLYLKSLRGAAGVHPSFDTRPIPGGSGKGIKDPDKEARKPKPIYVEGTHQYVGPQKDTGLSFEDLKALLDQED